MRLGCERKNPNGPVSRRGAGTTLAAMPGQKRLAGALAAVAAAMAISACGSSSDNATIPQQNADELNAALNSVQAAVDSGDCKAAEKAAGNFIDTVNNLPDTVGTDDKEALRSAGENLEELARDPQQCVPDTGASGASGEQPTSTTDSSTTLPPTTTETTTTSSTTSTTTQTQPAPSGGGNTGQPPSTGGGPPSTGGGGDTGGGGGVGGGTGGTGGTGTGGTGGGGTG